MNETYNGGYGKQSLESGAAKASMAQQTMGVAQASLRAGPTPAELRSEALSLAIQFHRGALPEPYTQVVKTATAFLAFLKGETPDV